MKPVKNNKHDTETFAKYLCGEMSDTELRDFENEFAASEENKKMIEKMKKHWSALEGYPEPKIPDTRKAWDNLHKRLHEERLIPARAIKSTLVPNLVKIAAVIVILMGMGALVYVNMNRKPALEMVQINTSNEANTLIKTLNDGSVIYLAHNSLFSFPQKFDEKSRNVELKGEAFFDVTPNPDQPFIIETEETVIEVLGTSFNVKTQNGNGFELFVDRGKVKVTLKNNPSHSELVIAGERISASNNNLVKSKYITNGQYSWYKQRMHFKDEPLQNIINVLNRNFNTTFVLAEKEVGNRKLTVTFHNETAVTMTELICVTLNLKSQNINGSVVLSENKEGAGTN